MQPQNLQALSKDALKAHYTQLTGKPATTRQTRQQLIDAITGALVNNGSILSVADVINDKHPQPARPTVHIIQKDKDGNVLDELVLPRAVWHNMPASLKQQWALKTPGEVKPPIL